MANVPPKYPAYLSSAEWSQTASARAGAVLLRSARTDAENRTSYLFADPVRILIARELDEIPAVFAGIEAALQAGCFVAGFLSYEAGYHFEPAALRSGGQAFDCDEPLAWFGVYAQPLIYDEPESCRCGDGCGDGEPEEVSVGITREQYCERIEQIRSLIAAGDFYQANFTVPMRQRWNGDAGGLFERMMAAQPVPYGALVNTGAAQILSASPELFFRKQGDRIVVRPMKGTCARGRDLDEDARQAAWLAGDAKNRAENVMIVDLLRNDLGRICRTGSVTVADLFAVERHPGLLQMTSTVRGELKPATSYYEIFRGLFPCGSITGAPKIRTMQAIRELEGEPRGVGFGAIGYFSPGGDAAFSVAIRTLVLKDGEARMRVGSGITYDSDAEAEYAECLLKAQFLTRPLRRFELIETIAWEGSYALLDLHLKRLQASAAYFDFCCDEESVRARLREYAKTFAEGSRQRVRLLLSRAGEMSLSSTPLTASTGPARILISAERTDSADAFLRHKTTWRHVYDRALADARAAGCDDALFLNERGEVTECAIHNVMIEKNGKLLMPPLECGLLPGVYRQHLLATHAEMEEAAITLDDVLSAERVFLFNSVRGLRQARIVTEADGK